MPVVINNHAIVSRGHDGQYVLVSEDNRTVCAGEHHTTRDLQDYIVTGGSAPHSPSSTGRVYCTHADSDTGFEFFPSVLGLRWVHVE